MKGRGAAGEALQARYRVSLARHLRDIEEMIDDLRAGAMDASRDIHYRAHQLHGCGATYGFPSISEAAAKISGTPDEDLLAVARQLCDALREHAAKVDTPALLAQRRG